MTERPVRVRTRAKGLRGALCLLLIGALAGSAAAADPEVLQPDAAQYTSVERSAFSQAISALEAVLADTQLGPRSYLGERGWSAAQFAAFSAGTLLELGYNVVIVERADPQGIPHQWILVETDLGSTTGWIPVEASPGPGVSQKTLGYIPTGAASVRFDENYIAFDRVVSLPANQPPVAAVRAQTGALLKGESITFLGLMSHDADGRIILYEWTIDDGRPTTKTTWTLEQSFRQAGIHTVRLTVIDDRGGRATTSIRVQVLAEAPDDEPGGCIPCGGG